MLNALFLVFQKKKNEFIFIIITISPFPKKLSKGAAVKKREKNNNISWYVVMVVYGVSYRILS